MVYTVAGMLTRLAGHEAEARVRMRPRPKEFFEATMYEAEARHVRE